MTFGQAIHIAFRKYAEFGGRATRPEFWWFTLFTFLVLAGSASLWAGLAGAWFFAAIVPSLAIGVRRLRDAGLGWGWLFFLLLPVVGPIVLTVLFAQPSVDNAAGLIENPATRLPPAPTP